MPMPTLTRRDLIRAGALGLAGGASGRPPTRPPPPRSGRLPRPT